MTRPIISFCIPTFNRSTFLEKTVRHILSYSGDDIEVVVSDNASPDDTEARMSALSTQDGRLRYRKNSENMGAAYNDAAVLVAARGKFAFLLSDEDEVCLAEIEKLKALADAYPQTGVIACSVKRDSGEIYRQFPDAVYTAGREGLSAVFMKLAYLSGIMYNTDYLQRRDIFDETWYREDVSYAHTLLAHILAWNFGAVTSPVYAIHIVENENPSDFHGVRGGSTFSRAGRLQSFENAVDFVQKYVSDTAFHETLFVRAFTVYLMAAVNNAVAAQNAEQAARMSLGKGETYSRGRLLRMVSRDQKRILQTRGVTFSTNARRQICRVVLRYRLTTAPWLQGLLRLYRRMRNR